MLGRPFIQISRIKEINKWDEDTAVRALSVSLQGFAADVLNCIPLEPGSSFPTWPVLISALQATFDRDVDPHTHRTHLRSRRQLPGETLSQLNLSIRLDVQLAYPLFTTREKEHMAVDIFLDAITDADIRLHLLRLQPRTV